MIETLRPLSPQKRTLSCGLISLLCPAMSHPLRELFTFGCAPFIGALVCAFGLVGSFSEAEAFVPIYLIGLIFSLTALIFYGFALLFRALRWFSVSFR